MSVYPEPYRLGGTRATPYPEFNPNGDTANGIAGGNTAPSVANAGNQATNAKGNNPFTAMLDHVTAFNSAMQPHASAVNQPESQPSYGEPTGGGGGGYPAPAPIPFPTGRTRAVSPNPAPTPAPTEPTGTAGTPTTGAPINQPPPAGAGFQNPIPKPTDPNSPTFFADLARHYQGFAPLNPAFANITAADVQKWQTLALHLDPNQGQLDPKYQDFASWYLDGMPSPSSGVGTINPINRAGSGPNQWTPEQAAQQTPIDPIAAQRGVTQTPTTPPPTTTPAETIPGRTPLPTNPADKINPNGAGPTNPVKPPHVDTVVAGPDDPADQIRPNDPTNPNDPNDEITRLIQQYMQGGGGGPQSPNVESLLDPMFARQRQNVIGDINAADAASGLYGSGGAAASRNDAVAGLAGQQSAALAGAKSQEYLARVEQETKYKELATNAGMQKYVADLNADLTRFQVNTNADLQKWLANEDNSLKKYGIDTNDVLQRYLGKLGIDKANIDAAATVNAAALHAAAAEAAAAASSAASQANAKLSYDLGMAGLGVDREKNIGNFILGLMGLGMTNLGDLNNILAGIPTGSVIIKP